MSAPQATLKPASLKAKHTDLMAAYRAAMRESERLDAFSRELVQHAVAVSSARAADQLDTHVEGGALVEATETYAEKVAKGDLVAAGVDHGSSWLGRAFRAFFGGQTLLAIIGLPAATIALGVLSLGRFVSTATAVTLIWVTLQSGLLGNSVRAAKPAKRVLAEALDSAEAEFFALTGAPPRRIFINLVGPLLASFVLIFLGLLAVQAVVAFSDI